MKKRFTEEQIIGVLKEAETDLKRAELRRKRALSEPPTATGRHSSAE